MDNLAILVRDSNPSSRNSVPPVCPSAPVRQFSVYELTFHDNG